MCLQPCAPVPVSGCFQYDCRHLHNANNSNCHIRNTNHLRQRVISCRWKALGKFETAFWEPSLLLQDNRDKRVELLQKYAKKFFPATKYMDYAVRVEKYTLGKAANLVLNVDGCIGSLFLDLLNSSSQFTHVSTTLKSPNIHRPRLSDPQAIGVLLGLLQMMLVSPVGLIADCKDPSFVMCPAQLKS